MIYFENKTRKITRKHRCFKIKKKLILKQRLQLRLLTFNTVGHLIRYAFQKNGKTLHKEGFNKLTIKIESKKWKKAKTKIIVIPFLLKTILVEQEVIRDRTSKTNICACLTKT